MKKLILAITLMPTLSFAGVYNCSGFGFVIDVAGNPLEMKITGNSFNSMARNVRATSTFDTIISGNTNNPAATIKLTIKDSTFGNPGDSFKAHLQISSSSGINEYTNLNCIRGND